MKEWDLPISPQSLVDQINREGAAWGLVGEYDEAMQRVFVCELRPQVDESYGLTECTGESGTRRICSVDDEHPFSAALAMRISNHEAIRPAETRHNAYKAQKAAQEQKMLDDHAAEVKAATKLRVAKRGAMFWPEMNRDLIANRKARRIREAMRRRGGG